MKTLIIDDDLVLTDVISFTLRRAGYEVLMSHDGIEGLKMWREYSPGLILLDWELPHLSGIEVCRQIRLYSSTPIIMLTVRDSDVDVIKGLGAGADDYITKPFSPTQLIARTQAVLRRAGQPPPPKHIIVRGMRLNAERKLLERHDAVPVPLTRLEYQLLETLMLNQGQVLPAGTLIDRVWGPTQGDSAMLKQLIYRLRRKIEPDPANPIYIQSVPGIGYTLLDDLRSP